MSTTEHVKGEQKIDSSQQPAEIEVEAAVHSSGVSIKVFAGDLTGFKGDAIVNAANTRLKHAGGLAKVIIEKGRFFCSTKIINNKFIFTMLVCNKNVKLV